MDNNTLTHWGIKGQKWGVRRYQNADGSLTPAGKKRYGGEEIHEDYKKAHGKARVEVMSDAELRERNKRLEAEANYARLTKKTSRGKKAVDGFIKTATTATAVVGAYAVYKGLAKQAIKTIGDLHIAEVVMDYME